MPEMRNMLQSLLKGRRPPAETTRYELVNASNSSFIPFSGNTYENDIARSAVWTIAEAAGKASFLHVRGEGAVMRTNPDPMIRLLMEQPNEFIPPERRKASPRWLPSRGKRP